MKKTFLAILLFCCGFCYAQQEGIRFETGDLATAMANAKKEKKYVFVDCYTVWCGPCQMMAKTVFTDKNVGDYFNQTFINLKVDMEKGEGPAMAKKYGVTAYPTFIFIDGDGALVHKFVGAKDTAGFIAAAKEAFNYQNVIRLGSVFKDKQQDTAFIAGYFRTLQADNLTEELDNAVDEYLAGINPTLYSQPFYWEIIKNYVVDKKKPAFQYVAQNNSLFIDAYGEDQVARFLKPAYELEFRQQFRADTGYETEAYEQFVKEIKGLKMSFTSSLLASVYAQNYVKMKDYDQLLKTVDDMFTYELVSNHAMLMFTEINFYAKFILANSGNIAHYNRVANWYELMLAREEASDFRLTCIYELKEVIDKTGDPEKMKAISSRCDKAAQEYYQANPIYSEDLEEIRKSATAEQFEAFMKELKRLDIKVLE